MPTGSSSAGAGGGVFDEAAQADEGSAPTGDLLDVLTPREISVTRYTQHHEWMEQILSSPWAVGKIERVNLGLGLAGDELSPLTEGIVGWEPDIAEPVVVASGAGGKADEVEVEKLTQAHVEKLEGRVRKFMEEGEAQIARMREEHRQRMEEMEGLSLFKDLERRLTEAMDEGAVEEGKGEEDRETVEEVVREMERRTGAKVGRREEVVTVSRGGLVTPGGGAGLRGDDGVGLEGVERVAEFGEIGGGGNSGLGIGNGILAEEDAVGEGDVEVMHGGGGGGDGLAADDAFGDLTNLDTAGEALDFYTAFDEGRDW